MADELKTAEVLSFDDGLLRIKVAGYGDANGWGEMIFHERQVDFDADGYYKVEIPPSELIAIRDFIDRLTMSSSLPAEDQT